jgi:hypothetical protein
METSGDDFAGLLSALGRTTVNQGPTLNPQAATFVPQTNFNPQNMWQPNSNYVPFQQVNSSLPSGMPTGMPTGMPGGMSSGMPSGMVQNVPYQLPQTMQPHMIPTMQAHLQNQPSNSTVQKTNFFMNPWFIGGICVLIVILLVVLWISFVRMNSTPEDNEEKLDANASFRIAERKEPRELPVPSSLQVPEEDISDYVTSNLLKYVNDFSSNEVVDISGQDVPLEYNRPPSPAIRSQPTKRIVAEESDEVEAYAKRRAALFANSRDDGRV